MMLFRNGLGNRKPYAKASAKGPCLIRTIKTVEQLIKPDIVNGPTAIFHRQHNLPPMPERNFDLPALVAVFDRVVKQDR